MAIADVPYERALVGIAACSALGMLVGIALGPVTDPAVVRAFCQRVRPHGVWPARQPLAAAREIGVDLGRIAAGVAGMIALLAAGHRAILFGSYGVALGLTLVGSILLAAALLDRSETALPADSRR
jgi:hypothetical protein